MMKQIVTVAMLAFILAVGIVSIVQPVSVAWADGGAD